MMGERGDKGMCEERGEGRVREDGRKRRVACTLSLF